MNYYEVLADEIIRKNLGNAVPGTIKLCFDKDENSRPYIVDFKVVDSVDNQTDVVSKVSIMKFADGTETKAICLADEFDSYTGFLVCYCKKLFGKEFHRTIKYWTEKEELEKARLLREEAKKEEEIRAEKIRQAKRERKRYRRMVREAELKLKAEREARNNLDGEA